MKTHRVFRSLFCMAMILLLTLNSIDSEACSTFKLQHKNELVYGHNLNEGDMGVPGLVFINKRGVFKMGRTWSELSTPDRANPSSHQWISRYGSVTFNCFGRDFPDGGMNEAGLYIWEMNNDADYPKNEKLPKLNQMNWMQYILDNFSTTDEAIQCAYDIEIEGWGWHYFIGDASGKTAAVHFTNGKVVVHAGEEMPIPGLFNTSYDRELELLKYYEGFGGLYPIDLDDPEVTRFAKTAKMLRDYVPSGNIVNDGFKMLDQIKVYDEPEWSIIMDVRKGAVYFKTRLNPTIKHFSFDQIDFSNKSPVLMVNMDIEKGGPMYSLLYPFSSEKMKDYYKESLFPILPEAMITMGGITKDEWAESFSSHTHDALKPVYQFFAGTWQEADKKLSLILQSEGDRITGYTSNGNDQYPTEHISLKGTHFMCTFKTKKNVLIEIDGIIQGERMEFGYRDASKNPAIKMTLMKQ